MPAPSKPKKERHVELPAEGMDVLEVSPLRLGGLSEVRADLAQHQRRIEKLLAEMLQKTQQVTSEVVRAEVQRLHGADQGAVNVPGLPGQVQHDVEETPATPSARGVKESWCEKETNEKREEKEEKSTTRRVTMRLPKLEKTKVTGVKEIVAKFTDRYKSHGNSEKWPAWRRIAKSVVASTGFEWFCASLILLCAMLIGAEAHWNIQNIGAAPPETFRILNTSFNLLFTIELVLRGVVEGTSFLSWYNPSLHWNVMDAVLVAVALVEEGILLLAAASMDLSALKALRMLRLARILRVVKVVRFFSELRIMVNGVIGSARSLCWALLLIVLVNFLFGVFFMQFSIDYLEVNQDKELMKYFGSLPRTMITLYQAISGGIDWNNAVETLLPVSPIIEYIFSAYVFFTVFCCLNIITGIFVDNAKALKVADLENMHQEARRERKKWIAEVAELFSRISHDHDGRLTKEDFVYHVSNSDRIATCFHKLGINTDTTNTDELWQLFDFGDSGYIDQDEFAIGIKQFHGQARSIDLYKLRKEVREVAKTVKRIVTVVSPDGL